jgi:hypothetical protein
MAKIDDFKTELKTLLDKYNASIACNIDGDTHCIITTMEVEIDKKDYTLCNGFEITKYDIV